MTPDDALRHVVEAAAVHAVPREAYEATRGELRRAAVAAVRAGCAKIATAAAAGVSRPTLDAWLSVD